MGGRLSDRTNEIEARSADEMRLVTASRSLDMLHRLRSTWQSFTDDLSALAGKLGQRATRLEEERARLDEMTQTWQATLQSAKQPDTPPAVLQSVQNVVDSIARTRQATESDRAQVLTLQSRVSEEEARVRRALASVIQVRNQGSESLVVRER